MRIQLLPSTIDENGRASARQHMLTLVIDDRVTIDAGSLAFACTDAQRENIRDIILTHTHLDHIAGLPMFIDDLFATLTEPIRIHATRVMIDILEKHIFNWSIYPSFSELSNDKGRVMEYREYEQGAAFDAAHLSVQSVAVKHDVQANGFIISDGEASIAITGDTGQTDEFWQACDKTKDLTAVFVECAFPDELGDLANVSCHLTPSMLKSELEKFHNANCPVYAINIKPAYCETVINQLIEADIPRVQILDVGKVYQL